MSKATFIVLLFCFALVGGIAYYNLYLSDYAKRSRSYTPPTRDTTTIKKEPEPYKPNKDSLIHSLPFLTETMYEYVVGYDIEGFKLRSVYTGHLQMSASYVPVDSEKFLVGQIIISAFAWKEKDSRKQFRSERVYKNAWMPAIKNKVMVVEAEEINGKLVLYDLQQKPDKP